MLGPRHANRDGKAELLPNAPADRRGDLGRRAEEMRAARDVGEGLVDRDPLHERREVAEDGDGGIAEALVVAEVPADEGELGAELARLAAGHAAVDAEGLGFVGGSEDHAATDGDRPAAQVRIEQLLDRGIEGVQVRMEDGGLGLDDVTCPVVYGLDAVARERRSGAENVLYLFPSLPRSQDGRRAEEPIGRWRSRSG